LPLQVAMVPPPDIVQASGPASAGQTHSGNANRADTQYRLDKPRRSSLKSSSLKKYNLGVLILK